MNDSQIPTSVFQRSPILKCEWSRVEACSDSIIRIFMSHGNCTDMSGAIAVATVINPFVRRIETVSGKFLDTVYMLGRDGWTAFEPSLDDRRKWLDADA